MAEKKKKSTLRSKSKPAHARVLAKKTDARREKAKKMASPSPAKKVAAKKARVERATKKPAAPKAHANELQVFDMQGKAVEKLALDPMFQGDHVNTGVVYQAVLMYQAGQREGTAATKTRGEVRGGGKKPWKQKGTGQARHGSRRSPIWRGGGATFGPHPRDYSYTVPKPVRRLAVIETMKDKVQHGKLTIVSRLDVAQPKTRLVAEFMETFKLEKPLFVVDEKSQNLILASRNIPTVSLKTAAEINALDVASHKECVLTKAAYAGLVARLQKS